MISSAAGTAEPRRSKAMMLALYGAQSGERFAFYGLASVMVLFLVAAPKDGGGGLSNSASVALTGSMFGAAYLANLVGGWCADKILSVYQTLLVGISLALAGYILLALPIHEITWPGLLLVIFGTGLFVPSVSTLLTNQVPDESGERDAAFARLYVAVNVGGLAATLITGVVAALSNWDYAFLVNVVGALVALLCLLFLRGKLNAKSVQPAAPSTPANLRKFIALTASLVAVYAIVVLLDFTIPRPELAISLIVVVLTITMPAVFVLRIARQRGRSRLERDRIAAIVVLVLFSTGFWFLASQRLGVLILLSSTGIDRHIGSWEFPANWFEALDPAVVIILGPLMAALWKRRGDRAPRTTTKFALGFAITAVALAILVLVGKAVDAGTLVGWPSLFVIFVLISVGELLLAPAGSSAVSRLAPPGTETQLFAVWYLSVGCGFAIGGLLGSTVTDLGYTWFAFAGAVLSAALAFGVWACATPMRRLMHGER